MKKYSNYLIPGWYGFTVVGWTIAGVCWWHFRHVYPRTNLSFAGYVMIPVLLQAFPMHRALRGGWMWAGAGILAGILAVFIQGGSWSLNASRLSLFYGICFAGLALSFTTALIFVRQSRHRETQPAVDGLEIDSTIVE